MKTLLIAPFPPPATGHSLAAQQLLEAARRRHEVSIVDLSKDGFTHGVDSARRISQVARILTAVWRKRRDADVVYLTIAESLAGNVKDLVIYLVCFRKLSRMVIHLHGGSIRRLLFNRHPFVERINRFFLRRVGAAVILGDSHREIFAGLVAPERIRVVANSAEDALFRTEAEIRAKFTTRGPLQIIFLSNLISGKGYDELLDGYLALGDSTKALVRLDFAGAFESPADRERFVSRIRGVVGVTYHGVVQGTDKTSFLETAHVLCLPTSLLEGQPVCILEAYASGCVVLATNCGGIRDVFEDDLNGILLDAPTPDAIRAAIERVVAWRESLVTIAVRNMRGAQERFTTGANSNALIAVLESVAGTTGSSSTGPVLIDSAS